MRPLRGHPTGRAPASRLQARRRGARASGPPTQRAQSRRHAGRAAGSRLRCAKVQQAVDGQRSRAAPRSVAGSSERGAAKCGAHPPRPSGSTGACARWAGALCAPRPSPVAPRVLRRRSQGVHRPPPSKRCGPPPLHALPFLSAPARHRCCVLLRRRLGRSPAPPRSRGVASGPARNAPRRLLCTRWGVHGGAASCGVCDRADGGKWHAGRKPETHADAKTRSRAWAAVDGGRGRRVRPAPAPFASFFFAGSAAARLLLRPPGLTRFCRCPPVGYGGQAGPLCRASAAVCPSLPVSALLRPADSGVTRPR